MKGDDVRVRACEGEGKSVGQKSGGGSRPSRQELEDYVRDSCPHLVASSLWQELEADGWRDSRGRPIHSWRSYVTACDRRAAQLDSSPTGEKDGAKVTVLGDRRDAEAYARILWDRMKDELVRQGFDRRSLDTERPLTASELGITTPPKGWREMLGAPAPSRAERRAKRPRPRKGQSHRHHSRKGGRR